MNWLEATREYYGARWFAGMERAYPHLWQCFRGETNSATLMKRTPTPERVAVIISGGGADGPLLPGFVGEGLADACVIGAPNTAPNAYALYEAGKVLGKEKGVLLLYNNFAGDYLNNDMAAEMLGLEGFQVESATCYDDMGMAVGEPKENRGGRCALPYLIKIAAGAAKAGCSLAQVAALTREAASRVSTLCAVADTAANQVSFGNGFSGEPGFRVDSQMNLRKTADILIELLLEDVQPQPDEKIYLLVNRLRLASYSDSYNMVVYLEEALAAHKHPVEQARVGAFFNVLDVYGYTVTLLCAGETLQKYLGGTIGTDCFVI